MFLHYLKRWTIIQKIAFFGCCWLIYGLLYYAINQITVSIDWLEVVSFVAVFALVAHGVYALLNWFMPSRNYGWGVLGLIGFYLFIWLVGNVVFNGVNPMLSVPMNGGEHLALTHPGYLKHIITIITNFSVIALAFYHAVRSVKYLVGMQEATAKKLEETERRLDAELEKQQYEHLALAGEVPPHFYANMVLSWKGQLGDHHRQVGESMEKMHDLLIYHVEAREPGREVVPLQAEIDYMRLYLALINKPGSPVFVTYELTDHTAGLTIPPTTLISFANNAVKHGVASDPTRPIRIKLSVKDDVMRFSCSNHKKKVSDQKSHGVGLANVRRRLEIQHEGAYTLETHSDGEIYRVDLTIHY